MRNLFDFIEEEIWWPIEDFFQEIPAFFRRIKRKTLNMWYWLPVVWKQEEWDHSYFYDLLAAKFHKMALEFERVEKEGNMSFYGIEEVIEDLKMAEQICKRLSDDYIYYIEAGGEQLNEEDGNYEDSLRKVMKLEELLLQKDLNDLADLLKDKSLTWWN